MNPKRLFRICTISYSHQHVAKLTASKQATEQWMPLGSGLACLFGPGRQPVTATYMGLSRTWASFHRPVSKGFQSQPVKKKQQVSPPSSLHIFLPKKKTRRKRKQMERNIQSTRLIVRNIHRPERATATKCDEYSEYLSEKKRNGISTVHRIQPPPIPHCTGALPLLLPIPSIVSVARLEQQAKCKHFVK